MKTALIVANGPSLADVPTSFFNKYPSFMANRVFVRDDLSSPFCYSIMDWKMVHTPELAEEALPFVLGSTHTFLSQQASYEFRSLVPERPKHVHVVEWQNYHFDSGQLAGAFSLDPFRGMVSGGTVTYVSMQLAHYYGFRRLLCVGLDHDFVGPKGDHFHPDYNKPVGIPYQYEPPDEWSREHGKWFFSQKFFCAKTEVFYQLAQDIFKGDGGEIINLTPDSKLDVFPIDHWRNW